ncbi:MAG: glycosyltransferase family 9 protein [Bacteroidales bacterium]|nr:glycosyltransferase family 9 protein [Bacteroidales bacterium]
MRSRILIYRFSSFGDVLITIPVIMGALEAYPELTIVFATRNRFSSYFPEHERLRVISLDIEKEYKGVIGTYKIFKRLKSEGKFDLLIDLHNVLRTQLLNSLFRIGKLNTHKLHKNRKIKRDYISGRKREVLLSTMEQYLRVFEKAGFKFSLKKPDKRIIADSVSIKKSNHSFHIGIAPFARHASKSWSPDNFVELISVLNQSWDIQFYVFGSKAEFQKASLLKGSNIKNSCGQLSAIEEITTISQLDLMVSMDSANMHLADILGIPVISIWGGTHPDIGFRPTFQLPEDMISPTVSLDCRPCSVFGKEQCKLKSHPFLCLQDIHAKRVAERISAHLRKKS